MSQRLSLRAQLLLAVGLSLLVLCLLELLPAYARASAPAATTNTADVVVQFGDGLVVTRRITFTGTISGLEALRRTGLALVEKGGLVCRIGDTGCAAGQDCFCACPPPYTQCLTWSYYRWDGSAWVYSTQGAAATTVANGAVEGWTWGRELPPVSPALLGAQAGLQWLKPRQGADGGYSGSNTGATIDTILANAAVGGDAATWRSSAGKSLLDALRAQARAYAKLNAASAGKLALGAAAADQDPHSFAGLNLVISMTANLNATTGAYGATNWDQAFSLLGMRASGETPPAAAVALLKGRANADGGWGFSTPGDSDVDSTGLVLQALIASGVPRSDAAIVAALAYLDAAQNDDGGFPNTPASNGSDTSNVNSTALAVQGILAGGDDPLAARWKPAASNAISYMLSLQDADGAFTFGGQASQIGTQQVVPALVGRTFPFLSRAVARQAALAYIKSQQQPDGSFAGFDEGTTIDAILAIDAAGGDPQSFVSSSGKRPLDYLRPRAAAYAAKSAATTGKLLAGIVAAGADPRSFGGLNLVISATLRYNASTGAFGSSTFDQAWSMIGLAAADQTIPLSATQRLQAMAAAGGGWGFLANAAVGDADSTGLALQALAAGGVRPAPSAALSSAVICTTGAGSSDPTVQAALAFLRSHENPDGGFHPDFDSATSPSSTGLALQGLAAYQDTPRGLSWTTVYTTGAQSRLTLHNPVDALLSLQTSAGGFPGSSGPNDPDSTYQALPGLLGRAFPSSIHRLIYMPVMRRNK